MGDIVSYSEMKKIGILSRDEINLIEDNREKLHRVGTTRHYLSISGNEPDDPLRMQFVPSGKELLSLEYETKDPLHESGYAVTGKIIHRYPDRILFLATGRCAMYCRHCFRRYLAEDPVQDAGYNDVKELCRYIEKKKNIHEVLVSGGDPLVLDRDFLEYLFRKIRETDRNIAIRIGTRVPGVDPGRVTSGLAAMLSRFAPLYVFTQFNHFREVTEASAAAVGLLADNGIPVFNQTVLLKGINNDESVLEKLFYSLIAIRVKPYYIFQGDLAAGTSHFRTNLSEGIEIMERLRTRMSALSLPLLAVDLPEGGGKALLCRESVVKRENGFYHIRSNEGKVIAYPDEIL